MKAAYRPPARGPSGPTRSAPGDPYELSDGHAIVSEPSGRRHGRRHLIGGAALATDPAVEEAGVEVGHVLDAATLRAPDVSVGGVEDEPGYAQAAPRLAVEYVERGGDEADLARKVAELLAAGTELVWVVRLAGGRRVEVHRAGEPAIVKHAGDTLEAPGILQNPVPVAALYDGSAARAVMLRNLLQRAGFADLDAVRAEGRLEYARDLLRRTLARRGLALDAAQVAAIEGCTDPATLDGWLERAHTAAGAVEVLRTD